MCSTPSCPTTPPVCLLYIHSCVYVYTLYTECHRSRGAAGVAVHCLPHLVLHVQVPYAIPPPPPPPLLSSHTLVNLATTVLRGPFQDAQRFSGLSAQPVHILVPAQSNCPDHHELHDHIRHSCNSLQHWQLSVCLRKAVQPQRSWIGSCAHLLTAKVCASLPVVQA